MLCQGALEEMLSGCTTVLEKGSVVPLDDARRTAVTKLGLSLNDEVSARLTLSLEIFLLGLIYLLLMPCQSKQETFSASLAAQRMYHTLRLHALHCRMINCLMCTGYACAGAGDADV